jgi:four helix bundle protein
MSSYKDLDIYKKALELFFKAFHLTMKLPKFELYEQGSQLRRSADGVVSQIVEGYGRRRYKADYIKFLTYSYSSSIESTNHCIKIKGTHPEFTKEFEQLEKEYDILSGQVFKYIEYVENNWKT